MTFCSIDSSWLSNHPKRNSDDPWHYEATVGMRPSSKEMVNQ